MARALGDPARRKYVIDARRVVRRRACGKPRGRGIVVVVLLLVVASCVPSRDATTRRSRRRAPDAHPGAFDRRLRRHDPPSSATDSSSSDLSLPHRTRRAFLASAALASALRDFAALARRRRVVRSAPSLASHPPAARPPSPPSSRTRSPRLHRGRADDVLLASPCGCRAAVRGGARSSRLPCAASRHRQPAHRSPAAASTGMSPRGGRETERIRRDSRIPDSRRTASPNGSSATSNSRRGRVRHEAAVDASVVAATSTSSSSLTLSTETDARIAANDGSSSGSFPTSATVRLSRGVARRDERRDDAGRARRLGEGNAHFVGLVKERQAWICPTFLGQTDVVSFALDFDRDELTLSRRGLIPRDLRSRDAGHDGPSTAGLARVSLRGSRRGVVDQRRSPPHRQARVRRLRQRHHRRARRPGALRVVRISPSAPSSATSSSGTRTEVESSSGRACERARGTVLVPRAPGGRPVGGRAERRARHIRGLAFLFNQGTMTVDADDRRLRLGGRPGP